MADYVIDYRTRAQQSDWNMKAQCDADLYGLASYVKKALGSYELP